MATPNSIPVHPKWCTGLRAHVDARRSARLPGRMTTRRPACPGAGQLAGRDDARVCMSVHQRVGLFDKLNEIAEAARVTLWRRALLPPSSRSLLRAVGRVGVGGLQHRRQQKQLVTDKSVACASYENKRLRIPKVSRSLFLATSEQAARPG